MKDEDAPEREAPAKAEEGKKSRFRKTLVYGLLGAVVAAGLGFGIPYYLHSLKYESTDDAFIDGDVVPISARVSGHVIAVHVRDNQKVEKGQLLVELDPADFEARLAQAKAELTAAKAGQRSSEIQVDLSEVTSRSDVDGADAGLTVARAKVEQARKAVASGESVLDQAKAAVTVADAQAEEAHASVAAARAAAKRDEADLARVRTMAQAKTVTEQALDHAVAAAESSAADLEAARKKAAAKDALVVQARAGTPVAKAQLDQAKAELAQAQAEVEMAKARVEDASAAPHRVALKKSGVSASTASVSNAEAKLRQARLMLSYTKIYAPSDGYVTRKTVEAGADVEAGQALLTIVRPELWVTANFKETQLTRMRPGQPATFTVDAYPGRTFTGRVDSIQHGTGARFSLLPPENATGNYVKVVQRVPVKIVFDEPPDLSRYHLAPGMSVVPEVEVAAKPAAHGSERSAKGSPTR